MSATTNVAQAVSTLRVLGWKWAVGLWLACSTFCVVVSITQNVNPVLVASILAGTGAVIAVGVWRPRVLGTGVVLVAVAPFLGVTAAWYAVNASSVVSLAEVNVRMTAVMTILAVVAHQLPGRPWVRLLCAAGFVAAPGLLLVKVVPALGVFAAYLAATVGLSVPSAVSYLKRKAWIK